MKVSIIIKKITILIKTFMIRFNYARNNSVKTYIFAYIYTNNNNNNRRKRKKKRANDKETKTR